MPTLLRHKSCIVRFLMNSILSSRALPMNEAPVYRRILVAIDFSSYSDAALNQAVFLARKIGASLTLVHVLPNVRSLLESATYAARVDFLYGQGNVFRAEVQQKSESQLKVLASELEANGLVVSYKTLLGAPYAEITRLVIAEKFDLVLIGTRGHSAWKQFLLGSTSQRLIRTCPASVWVVKAEDVDPPKIVLAATDFSDVGRRAVQEGLAIARQTDAAFHLVHVIDVTEFPQEILVNASWAEPIRREIEEETRHRLKELISSPGVEVDVENCHMVHGAPWHEVGKLASEIHADLIVLGSVGRSGLRGAVLGNTAERVLHTCDCSILTVKPDGFVSPVLPPLNAAGLLK